MGIDKNRGDFLAVIVVALLVTIASLPTIVTLICCTLIMGCAVFLNRMPEQRAGYILGGLALASSGMASAALFSLIGKWPIPVTIIVATGAMALTALWLVHSWNNRIPVRYGQQVVLSTVFGTRTIHGPTRIRIPKKWLGSRIIARLSLRTVNIDLKVEEIDIGAPADLSTTIRIIRPELIDLAAVIGPSKVRAVVRISYSIDGGRWFLLYNIPSAEERTAHLGVGRDRAEYWEALASDYICEEASEVLRRVIHREGWSAITVRDQREMVAAEFLEEMRAETEKIGLLIHETEMLTVDIDTAGNLRAALSSRMISQETAESQTRVGSMRIALHRDILRQMRELLNDPEHPLPAEAIAAIVRSQIRELSRSNTPLSEFENVLKESLELGDSEIRERAIANSRFARQRISIDRKIPRATGRFVTGSLPTPTIRSSIQERDSDTTTSANAATLSKITKLKQNFLKARFDGYQNAAWLPIAQWLPMVIWVGSDEEEEEIRRKPFAFNFAGIAEPVEFMVSIDGQAEIWDIQAAQPIMIVAPFTDEGVARSIQDATFLVRAKQPGQHKLYIQIAQRATGTIVQDLWIYVRVGEPPTDNLMNKSITQKKTLLPVNKFKSEAQVLARREEKTLDTTGESDSVRSSNVGVVTPPQFAIIDLVRISQPLNLQVSSQYWVHLLFDTPNTSSSGFTLRVDARLPDWDLSQRYEVPVSNEELRLAAGRLRRELERIVNYYQNDPDNPYPFSSQTNLTVSEHVMRKAVVDLADAGRQIWDMLFNRGGQHSGLLEIAKRLRHLPLGTVVDIRLENPKFGLPWLLLYDRPGPISAETIDWSGFWGYRFDLRTLYPGDYPGPVIDSSHFQMLMAFYDDQELADWISKHKEVVHTCMVKQCCSVVVGQEPFLDMLRQAESLNLIYTLCYGHRATKLGEPLALPSEATIFLSPDRPTRVADLRRLELSPFAGRPLVFMNTCEGASRDPLHQDDFVSYFIKDQQARGCIGTEVIVPKYLAHRYALDFLEAFAKGQAVGPTMWRLRREYLDKYNNILAFNYSLYGNGDIRLSEQLASQAKSDAAS